MKWGEFPVGRLKTRNSTDFCKSNSTRPTPSRRHRVHVQDFRHVCLAPLGRAFAPSRQHVNASAGQPRSAYGLARLLINKMYAKDAFCRSVSDAPHPHEVQEEPPQRILSKPSPSYLSRTLSPYTPDSRLMPKLGRTWGLTAARSPAYSCHRQVRRQAWGRRAQTR